MLESTDMHLESLDEPDSLLRRFCWYRKKLIVRSCSTAATLDILTDLIALRDPLDSRPVIDKWVYATGEKENNKTLARDKREGAITCVFCRDLHLTFMFSSRLQDCEDPLFTERWSFSGKHFQTKLLSSLSHKVCRRPSSLVLLRKFTIQNEERYTPRV